MLFEKENFEVDVARNGYEALEKVQESVEKQDRMFNLVLLDINMPIMNGFEACDSIRKLYETPKLFNYKQLSHSS